MHDIADFESRGVPGVFVASEPFRDGALVQANALGLDVARVFVAHPIQDRTDDEMVALAKGAIDALAQALVSCGE